MKALENKKVVFGIAVVGFIVLFIFFNYAIGGFSGAGSTNDGIPDQSPIERQFEKYINMPLTRQFLIPGLFFTGLGLIMVLNSIIRKIKISRLTYNPATPEQARQSRNYRLIMLVFGIILIGTGANFLYRSYLASIGAQDASLMEAIKQLFTGG